nr:glycosyl hydrolase family 65 protein [Clostridium rhizosphaerae]
MFHLLQSVGRDGKTNIGAKGLSGEGYEGHYFWDTEIYMLPFFLYNNPDISRKLLEYRYSILPNARERARIMSHKKGALYPWRTIDGDECSAYFPAGTAQYHINADIAFAIKRYMEATEDKDFLLNYGAEILFETARLWADLGEFIENKGNKFCINDVTGPDEYTAIVNNNCYTNLMAKENLEYAYKTAVWMKENAKEAYEELINKIGFIEDELQFWKKASDNMYIPYNEELGIYLQDDSFLYKTPWDFENTPKENYPLLLHYHPLVIYRHQVCKQADLVLAEFLLNHKFDIEQKRRDYDFYEKVTTHDSSLSTCIFSIMASEVGYHDKAYKYFMETATMDLTDSHRNTKDGIHAANMAGAGMCLVNGFAGMRVYEDTISFNPYIPKEWQEYKFKVTYRGRLIEIKVNKDGTSYRMLEGESLEIVHRGEKKIISNEELRMKN